MASSSDIKGFFRQKKKGGVTKPATAKKKSSKYTGGASVGAPGPAQTPSLIAHGSVDLDDEYGEEEERLRQFDMDMKYGPCIGLSRLQRWERAAAMGLNPPTDVASVLQGSKIPSLDCLWEGRV